ncbi:phage tail protein [Brevundimonas vesicularis]|uniref:Phage tail protein n=1 Tax=Brevundimonas vesicularis TaxID=41276 RepID=A0ABU4KNS8_BREVE|nr:phage tail protein [Brevundimonas vesicularis]MDX2334621.1 phage tail protein [Brevundimonas vesicularis]
MGKALKTVGVIIGGAALIATGVGALAMPALAGTTTLFGVSVGTLNTISSGLVAVGGMLDKPKSQGSAAPDEWTSNPDQPIPFLMGRMGVAGKIVQRDEFGPDNMYQGIVGIISGAGPIRGVNGFAGDKQPVTFGANGIAVTSQWEGEMWMVRRAGNQPDTALAVPTGLKSGGAAFEWSPAARLSGKACYLQVLGENSKGTAYPAGIPDPVHDAEGIFGYDPRYDDTYPGGAGPCRLGVRSTYRWINDGGIGALNWALGLVENGQVVGGIGASIDGIDVPAFVEVANIADANGWTLSAWPDTSEDASAVLDQLLQAAGAVRARHAGKISCVSRGAPRASVATITARDTAGDIELDTAPSLFNRLNTITPRFMSEAAGWVLTPANPVSFAQYVTDDGGKHSDQIDYRFVSSLKQAAELAAYDILDAREPFSGTIPLKAHMRHLKRGDTFLVSEPGFLMDGVKCIVLSRSYDPKTAQVRIGFRSETDSKHALALGKTTTLPEFPVLTPTDPTEVSRPLPGDWTITPRPPSQGGAQQPGFDLTGFVSNSTATAIIVETGPSATGPWKQAYQGPPTVTNIPIDGLQSGATYYIAIQYRRDNNYSERHIYGPYTAPILDPGPSAPSIVNLQDQVTAAFGDIFNIDGLLTQARTDIDAQGVEIAAARGDQPSLNSRIVQVNQARIDGDTSNAQAISLVQARTANTEADIIDLENALATETGARAQAIQQVTARQAIRPNLVVNSTAAQGMQGLTNFGSRTVVAYPAAPDGPQWAADAGGGSGLSFGARWASRPAKAGFPYSLQAELGGFGMTNGQVRAVGVFRNAGGGVTGHIVATAFYDAFAGGYVLRRTENVIAPAETVSYDLQIDVDDGAFTSGGSVGWKRVKLEQGPICTLWSDDASSVDISASVTQQSLAIIDLENQQNIALWRVKAEASGSRPAIIEAISGLGVSALAFSAEQLYLGDNTVFDDATNTWQTIDGSTVYIRAEGAPFGAFSNLREWWGPTGIALGAMTPDNGYSGRMTTAPYNFTNTLNPRTFSAYASPGSIEAHRSDAGSLTSAAVSILYQNAKGAVSVTWERLIGGVTAAGTAVIDAPTALTTTFTKTVSAQERTDTVFQATLTDAGSGERRQVIVPVVFTSGAA